MEWDSGEKDDGGLMLGVASRGLVHGGVGVLGEGIRRRITGRALMGILTSRPLGLHASLPPGHSPSDDSIFAVGNSMPPELTHQWIKIPSQACRFCSAAFLPGVSV